MKHRQLILVPEGMDVEQIRRMAEGLSSAAPDIEFLFVRGVYSCALPPHAALENGGAS